MRPGTPRAGTHATGTVADFLRLAHDTAATNTAHAGIVLVPASFREDAYRELADAIEDLKPYPHGLGGIVLYVKRREG